MIDYHKYIMFNHQSIQEMLIQIVVASGSSTKLQ